MSFATWLQAIRCRDGREEFHRAVKALESGIWMLTCWNYLLQGCIMGPLGMTLTIRI
jgi:hypothetical protein